MATENSTASVGRCASLTQDSNLHYDLSSVSVVDRRTPVQPRLIDAKKGQARWVYSYIRPPVASAYLARLSIQSDTPLVYVPRTSMLGLYH